MWLTRNHSKGLACISRETYYWSRFLQATVGVEPISRLSEQNNGSSPSDVSSRVIESACGVCVLDFFYEIVWTKCTGPKVTMEVRILKSVKCERQPSRKTSIFDRDNWSNSSKPLYTLQRIFLLEQFELFLIWLHLFAFTYLKNWIELDWIELNWIELNLIFFD